MRNFKELIQKIHVSHCGGIPQGPVSDTLLMRPAYRRYKCKYRSLVRQQASQSLTLQRNKM